jgi:hypothetical protein
MKFLRAVFVMLVESWLCYLIASQSILGVTTSARMNVSLRRWIRAGLTDSRLYWVLGIGVLVADSVLTELIIRFVPCE